MSHMLHAVNVGPRRVRKIRRTEGCPRAWNDGCAHTVEVEIKCVIPLLYTTEPDLLDWLYKYGINDSP